MTTAKYENIERVTVERENHGIVEFTVKCEDKMIHIFAKGSDLGKYYKNADNGASVEASIVIDNYDSANFDEYEADIFPCIATSHPRVRDNENNIMYIFTENEKLLVAAVEQEGKRMCGLEHTNTMCFESTAVTNDTEEVKEETTNSINLESIVEAFSKDFMAATMIGRYATADEAEKSRIMTYLTSLVSAK